MWSRQSPLIHKMGVQFLLPSLALWCVIGASSTCTDASSTRHRRIIGASSMRHRSVIGASSVRHHNQSGEKRVVGDKDPEAAG